MCVCDSLRVSYFLLQDKKSTSTTDADDDQPVHPVEADGHCSNQVDSLRFEVKFICKSFWFPLYKKVQVPPVIGSLIVILHNKSKVRETNLSCFLSLSLKE